tara:strand:- start:80 stop:409 length:330 start_codon:yes stop_codon:yes gene_type:complete
MPAEAEDDAFSATPSECIAAEKGDECVMSVTLHYPPLPDDKYCLRLNREPLGCWPYSAMPGAVKVTLKEESELSLVRESNTYQASVILTLRYRSASMLRRRVKNPWSLF